MDRLRPYLSALPALLLAAGVSLGADPPANPDAANHHVLFAGQEDDFGANYIRRYKFVPAWLRS